MAALSRNVIAKIRHLLPSMAAKRYGSLDQLNMPGEQHSGVNTMAIGMNPPPRKAHVVNLLINWLGTLQFRFMDCLLRCTESILRTLTPTIPVTTNFMGFHKPVDY